MKIVGRLPVMLWLIVAVGLTLRLLGAWYGNLMFDERAHLALAQTIDFHPDRFHLVFRSLDHPLLSIYILKLSGLLFGESNFGLRILHVLFGTATIVPVYLLGCELQNRNVGLWAAALLAVDQFHASWSRMFMPEVIMLFFWSLAMLQISRAVRSRRAVDFIWLGVWLGLAYLGKETGILLLPVAWAFLLVCREHRSLLWDRKWYLAHAAFVLVIAPDILWNLAHFSESYLQRDAQLLSETFRLQLKPVSLYLGELIQIFINENALDTDYQQGNAFVCHWPVGALYLISVGLMLQRPLPTIRRLFLLSFAIVFVFFTFLPGGNLFEPFWWASSSLLPAIVLTAAVIEKSPTKRPWKRWGGMILLSYLTGHTAMLVMQPGGPNGQGYPRATTGELAAVAIEGAQMAIGQRDWDTASSQLIYALNMDGPNADVYFLQGYLHSLQNNDDAAEAVLLKAIALESGHRAAAELLEHIRKRK